MTNSLEAFGNKPQPSGEAPGCTTVYYDGSCPLCAREIGFYQDQSGAEALAFVDVAGASGDELAGVLPANMTRADALKRFHLKRADGQVESGAAAFATLWLTLPRFRLLGVLVRRQPVLWMAEAAYLAFLRVRPLLQRLASRDPKHPQSNRARKSGV